ITLGVSVARKVTRAAVVADAGWIRASMHLARLFTKAEVKTFHVNELEQARVWINA
ncbi:SpoIIAA family protein, partial [Caballeronia choica]|uniref:STAS/SEC14 domain-containing protein n=1 Tax=Caballeronia choica TaxID=326476 RepID=UPI000AB400C1